MINSHHHFDHSGGLRTYVDEGATIVTHQLNRPYYEQAWAAPRTLNPDRLAQSKKTATFETLTDKHVLTDGKRSIEVHHIAGNGHNDAFVLVYLPTEKVLIEVDAWAPLAANAPPPAAVKPIRRQSAREHPAAEAGCPADCSAARPTPGDDRRFDSRRWDNRHEVTGGIMGHEGAALVNRWFDEVWTQGREATIDELMDKTCMVHRARRQHARARGVKRSSIAPIAMRFPT